MPCLIFWLALSYSVAAHALVRRMLHRQRPVNPLPATSFQNDATGGVVTGRDLANDQQVQQQIVGAVRRCLWLYIPLKSPNRGDGLFQGMHNHKHVRTAQTIVVVLQSRH